MSAQQSNNSGFTLIELSIVLVIIGLISSSILLGTDLIEAGKRRKLVSQLFSYRIAFTTFKLKYGQLPGDYSQAVAVLGASGQGDGDGIIRSHWNPVTCGPPYEYQGVFEHLSLAGLLQEKARYSWSSQTAVIGQNVPETVYAKIGILAMGICPAPSVWSSILRNDRNHFQIGSVLDTGTTTTDFLWGGGLNALQSYDIDKKIDDGKPLTGAFQSTNGRTYSDGNYSTVNPYGNCYNSSTKQYNSTLLNTGCTNYMETDN